MNEAPAIDVKVPTPALTNQNRVIVLVLIMASALLIVTGATIWFLYRAAFASISARLVETAQSQARLIEAISREESTHPELHGDRASEVVLEQLIDAHLEYRGHGETSEFTVARREGELMVFLLGHRHDTVEPPDPVPFGSDRAEPMTAALSGRSGTMVGRDYAGNTVLAAFEPARMIDGGELGVVAKIDLDEVQAPFVTAGLIAIGFSVVVAFFGAVLVVRISHSFVTQIQERSQLLTATIAALSESEKRFRTTFELAGVGIARVELDGRFSVVNDRFCEMVGYAKDEIMQLRFRDITHPDDLAADLEHARRLLAGEVDRYAMEKRYLRKDSTVIWVNLNGSIVRDAEGRPIYFIAVVEDISARKRAELEITRSLAEKEVLLREIHHRVKNNMQVISSLLNLQSTTIDDPRLRAVFQESQSRVRAMALIHEVLYNSGDLAGINLKEYLSRLTDSLTRMYGASGERIRLDVEPDEITLKLDASVPCGLAINELISNSLKHAHPDGRQGEIDIQVREVDGREIVFVVSDDGIGIPADLDVRTAGSMGMGIVLALVEKQLGGRLSVDCSRGTSVTIAVPVASVAV